MRVAVQCPDDHPVSPGAVFAYRLGRIEQGVHNVVLHTGVEVPIAEFVGGLAEQARGEYAQESRRLGCGPFDVRVERLIRHPDAADRAYWIRHDEYDPQVHDALAPGETLEREVTVVQPAESEAVI